MRKKITRRKFLKSVGTVGGAAVFGGFNISNHSFAQAKEPIKVGCIIPLTGPFGTEAKDQEAGVTLAVEELNAKGGVLGRKVELLVRDDKLKPDESARRAKELIEKDQVHLMIGSLGAHTQLAINEQCKLAKTIFMSISKSNELTVAKDVSPYTFAEASNPYIVTQALGPWVFQNLGKKWFFLAADYSFGWQLTEGHRKIGKELGFTEAGLINHPLGTADYTAYFPKILAAEPEVLILNNFGKDQLNCVKQVHEFGLKKKMKVVCSVFLFYDQVLSDPDIACFESCLEIAKKQKFELIIGVGGGSSMDIASITSVMLTNPGTVYDYFGVNLVKNPGIPTILIPTTAGTGAEVTPNAILTDTKEKLKKAVVSPYILPRVAIVDPLLTVSMPPSVTSSSGIDALTHAVESYTSNTANILTDLFAKEAMMMIGRSIRTAVANGNNLEARYDMSIGSLYAGISLANAGVTAVHALAYPLGGTFNVAHGIANGLLLPYVMEFNVLGNIPKFAQIAQFLGSTIDTPGPSVSSTTIAFNPFDPITAPAPPLPACLQGNPSTSVEAIVAVESFISPTGPIDKIPTFSPNLD